MTTKLRRRVGLIRVYSQGGANCVGRCERELIRQDWTWSVRGYGDVLFAEGSDGNLREAMNDMMIAIEELFEEEVDRACKGDAVELSAAAEAARKPLPPEDLVDAQHDRVHRDRGRSRAARTVRNKRRGTDAPP